MRAKVLVLVGAQHGQPWEVRELWVDAVCLPGACSRIQSKLPCSPPALFFLVSFSCSKLELELGPMLLWHCFTVSALKPHAKAKRRKFTRAAARKSALNGCGHCTCLESLVFVKCFESPGGWMQAVTKDIFGAAEYTLVACRHSCLWRHWEHLHMKDDSSQDQHEIATGRLWKSFK